MVHQGLRTKHIGRTSYHIHRLRREANLNVLNAISSVLLTIQRRRYEAFDFFHYKAYHTRVPRIKCDEHGIKTVIFRGQSNTGFTLMFETLIIMCKEMPVSAVARIVRTNELFGESLSITLTRQGKKLISVI